MFRDDQRFPDQRHIASFDCTAPDGARVTLTGVSGNSMVGDVLEALDSMDGCSRPHGAPLTVDGCVVSRDQTLAAVGLRHGSRLEWGTAIRDDERPGAAALEAVWIAGPDAGATCALPEGLHVIGRSRLATIRCADPALELHHARLVVDPRGTALITQLCGREAIEVDGAASVGAVPIWPGQRIRLGNSLLEIRAAATAVISVAAASSTRGADSWRVPFVRTARPIPTFAATTLVAPRRERPRGATGGGLIPTMLGVAGAAMMALLLHQVMFLLFGLMGALVAVGTWVAQRVGARASRRGAHLDHERSMGDFAEALRIQRRAALAVHVATTPTIDRAVLTMQTRAPSLWAARCGDPDHAVVSIGIGDASWTPSVSGIDADTPPEIWNLIESASRLTGVAVPASIDGGAVLAVVGHASAAAAVARSMVMQLAASSGPSEWQLAVIAEQIHEWECLGWLNHAVDSNGAIRIVAPRAVGDLVADAEPDDSRRLVVVLDRPDLLAARTSALRRLMAGKRSVGVIVLCASEREVPAVATSSLVLGRRGEAKWTADTRLSALPEPVRTAGISARAAGDAAAAIAHLIDPETNDDSTMLSREVGLTELLDGRVHSSVDDESLDGATVARRIADAWSSAGSDPAPAVPLGRAADGVVEIDLVADGPHALVAGTTGSGKSELLRTLVVGLAARMSPEHVNFVLVDYKGGSTFDACAGLAHVVGVVTDLDDRLAARALRSLDAELRRREQCLRDVGAIDLTGYRAKRADPHDDGRAPLPPLPRLVVVIDEFAALVSQQPTFIGALLGIAQRGRSLGVHLILATQRPSGVISDDIRANTNLRIALRVQDSADSNDVLGDPAAAQLPRSIAGRAIMRLGVDEFVHFQTARCTRPLQRTGETALEILRATPEPVGHVDEVPAPDCSPSELEWLVSAINSATLLSGCGQPHRPWLPALSPDSGTDMVESDAVGVLDEPDHQRQVPLRWRPHDGHLLIAGAPGMGCTSALLTIASMLFALDRAVEVFVIDAVGDARLRLLDEHSRCSAVVGVHERERLMRLLAAVDAARLARKVDGSGAENARREMVLMIDGLSALRSELEQHDLFAELTQLDNIVADGPSVGIVVVGATHQPGALASQMLSQIAHRWVLHLADPLDAAVLGVPTPLLPDATPGRVIIVASRSEAQLARFDPDRLAALAGRDLERTCRAHGGVTSVLRELPDEVKMSELPIGADSGGDVVLAVALSYATLRPCLLPVAHGEHALVIGPSRSGRTTTLAAVAHAWHHAVPHGWIASVAPRRSSARLGRVFPSAATLLDEMPVGARGLIIIDDAELVDDPSGLLAAVIADRRDDIAVIAAGRPDALRTSYGHWTAAVRRSRLGVVLASCTDIDGDLLSVALPRRTPIAPRPGLGWIVADGEMHLAQIALAESSNSMSMVGDAAGPRRTGT